MSTIASPAEALSAALAHLNAGQLSQALHIAESFPQDHPRITDALQIKALVRRAEGHIGEALKILEHGLALRPGAVGLQSLYFTTLADVGQYDRALTALEKAMDQKPGSAAAYNKALIHLCLGQFDLGLPLFEQRRVQPGYAVWQADAVPEWTGGDLSDAHLLVTAEQGLGDQILLSSLIPVLSERCHKLTLSCDPRLVPLFARSFCDADVVAHTERGPDLSPLQDTPSCWSLAGSLPLKLGANWPSDRRTAPFLRADAARTSSMSARYREIAAGRPVIGVSWSSPLAPLTGLKSIPPVQFTEIFNGLEVLLVSLQYAASDQDIQQLSSPPGIELFSDSDVSATADIDGVAAQCLAMDHIVSISTSVVHLAGALGCPTTVLLPKGSSAMWYWSEQNGLGSLYDSVSKFH